MSRLIGSHEECLLTFFFLHILCNCIDKMAADLPADVTVETKTEESVLQC